MRVRRKGRLRRVRSFAAGVGDVKRADAPHGSAIIRVVRSISTTDRGRAMVRTLVADRVGSVDAAARRRTPTSGGSLGDSLLVRAEG